MRIIKKGISEPNSVMTKESNKITPILSIGILTAVLTAYSYATAYVFEKNFCLQFQIPLSFIEIGVNELIRTIEVVVPLIGLIFFSMIISIWIQTSKNPVIRIVGRSIFPLFIFIMWYLIMGGSLIVFIIIFLVVWFIYIGSDLIFPLLKGWKIKGYKKRLKALEESDSEPKNILDKISDLISDQIGPITFWILFILVFALFFFVGPMGKQAAQKQKSFMIIKSKPELVVLRKYSQNYICAPFDRKRKEIEKKFYIKSDLQISEDKFEIVTEDIGPLKVLKEKAISLQELKKILNIINSVIPPLGYF